VKRAVFLDRDGVIIGRLRKANTSPADAYLFFCPGVRRAVRELLDAGFVILS